MTWTSSFSRDIETIRDIPWEILKQLEIFHERYWNQVSKLFRGWVGGVNYIVGENSKTVVTPKTMHERRMGHFYYSCEAVSWAELYCGDLGFLFRRLTHFFRFTFVHTAKLKKSNFVNDFFLLVKALARVTSFLTRFAKSFCVIRFWSYVTYLTQ